MSFVLGALALAQAAAGANARYGDRPGQDVLSYELNLRIDDREAELEGSVKYRIRAVEPLDSIRLDAIRDPHYPIRFFDEEGASAKPLPLEWTGDEIQIPLGRTVEQGSTLELFAYLEGHPPDGFFFSKTSHGKPIAYTDHYSIRAHGWFPCEDNPADRASFDVGLEWPAGFAAVVSGVPDEENPDPGPSGRTRLRHHTVSDIPPYMLTIVVGPFERVEEKGDERLLPHHVYRQDVANARLALTSDAAWIALMERSIGPYAYERYTTVQCPTRWGGFEAPGNVLLNEHLFDDPKNARGTLAHELVHMWFGDAVGYAEWREVWLSEGFASYFGPWLLSQTGGPPLEDALREMRERWLASPEGDEVPVRWDGFDHPDHALNANTYPKGAWILHMLREEIGDEAFFAGLRAYYAEHRGHSVTTADLVTSMEAASKRELDEFFAQWLDRPGCPKLRFTRTDAGLELEQVGSGAPWRFRLRVGWTDAGGASASQVFEINEAKEVLALPAGITGVPVIDPAVELLYRTSR
jgi:aminopeptidase N